MIQLRTVNKALASEGINAELVKGEGYFYFVGDDMAFADSTSVYCYTLNELELTQWIEEAVYFKNVSTSKKQLMNLLK